MTDPQLEMFNPVIGLGLRREELAQPQPSPFNKAMEISTRVGNCKWTGEQQRQVDSAILTVSERKTVFTSDDIWAELGPQFPVTKGLAGRLNAAVKRKIIVNTGHVTTAKRGGLHDHAQRLTIWAAYGV